MLFHQRKETVTVWYSFSWTQPQTMSNVLKTQLVRTTLQRKLYCKHTSWVQFSQELLKKGLYWALGIGYCFPPITYFCLPTGHLLAHCWHTRQADWSVGQWNTLARVGWFFVFNMWSTLFYILMYEKCHINKVYYYYYHYCWCCYYYYH